MGAPFLSPESAPVPLSSTELESVSDGVRELRRQLSEQAETLEHAQVNATSQQKEMVKLREQVSQLETKVSEAKSHIDTQDKEITHLRSQIARLFIQTQELDGMRKDMMERVKGLDDQRKELNEQTKQVSRLSEQVVGMQLMFQAIGHVVSMGPAVPGRQ